MISLSKSIELRMLRTALYEQTKMRDTYDAIEEYRRWFKDHGVQCDDKDGQLKGFCFEYCHIWRFVDWWCGGHDDLQSLIRDQAEAL